VLATVWKSHEKRGFFERSFAIGTSVRLTVRILILVCSYIASFFFDVFASCFAFAFAACIESFLMRAGVFCMVGETTVDSISVCFLE
jgi:hypothetical protein